MAVTFKEYKDVMSKRWDVKAFERVHGLVFLQYAQPFVYGIWKNEECFYIGCSKHGFSRLFDRQHHVLSKHPIKPKDTIYLWYPKSNQKLEDLERKMIAHYNPKMNRVYYE